MLRKLEAAETVVMINEESEMIDKATFDVFNTIDVRLSSSTTDAEAIKVDWEILDFDG